MRHRTALAAFCIALVGDGSTIAFAGPSGNTLSLMNADGTNLRNLGTGVSDYFDLQPGNRTFGFTADGQWLAVGDAPGTSPPTEQIRLISVAGGLELPTRLLPPAYFAIDVYP